jgi:hypothetical protein
MSFRRGLRRGSPHPHVYLPIPARPKGFTFLESLTPPQRRGLFPLIPPKKEKKIEVQLLWVGGWETKRTLKTRLDLPFSPHPKDYKTNLANFI